jgi:ATP-dependent Clp protease ATP-binding subunit ClpC
VGFAEGDGRARDDDRAYYTKQVESNFRPEFVNRIDRIVAFRSLSRGEVREVVRLAVARVRTRRGLVGAATELLVSDAALARLAHDGYSDVYGARALRRHVEERLVGPIARLLGSGNWDGPRDKIDVRADVEVPYEGPERVLRNEAIGGLRVVVLSRPRGAARAQARVWDLSEVRREMQRWIRLPKVAELKSHLEFLVAQLSYGQNGKKERARSTDVAQLGAEHARLHHVYDALARGLADVQSAEELGFLAFFAGESVEALLEESKELRVRFRDALFDALVCRDPRRHGVTLVLSELDEGRAFDRWLAPLLETMEQRSWSCELHIDGEAAEPAARWAKDRRWGPPRDADYVLDKLSEKDRAFKNLLFRVRGPNAGILLGLEGGLHRMHGAHESVQPVHMMVTRIAFRTAFQDKEWVPPILNPPPPAETSAAIRQLPVRELNYQTDTLEIMKRVTMKMPLHEYWTRQREIALEQLLLFETIDDLDLDAFLTTRFVERWDDVLDLARRGEKIAAIKLYRDRTGTGLLEAKNYVDSLE